MSLFRPPLQAELLRFGSVTHSTSLPPIVPLNATAEADADAWCQAGLVHRGEAQAIELARQLGADYLLTDDAAARLLAISLGLRARGSLGIILWLAGQRLLGATEASTLLDRLASTSLWVSPRIIIEARTALRQIADS